MTKTTDVDSWRIGRCLERVVRQRHRQQLCSDERHQLLSVSHSGLMNSLTHPTPLANHSSLDGHEYCFRPTVMGAR